MSQSLSHPECFPPLPAVVPFKRDAQGKVRQDFNVPPLYAGQLVFLSLPYSADGPESIHDSTITSAGRGRCFHHICIVDQANYHANHLQLRIFVCRAFSKVTVDEAIRTVARMPADKKKSFIPILPSLPTDPIPECPTDFGEPLQLDPGFRRLKPTWVIAVPSSVTIPVDMKFRPFPPTARVSFEELERLNNYYNGHFPDEQPLSGSSGNGAAGEVEGGSGDSDVDSKNQGGQQSGAGQSGGNGGRTFGGMAGNSGGAAASFGRGMNEGYRKFGFTVDLGTVGEDSSTRSESDGDELFMALHRAVAFQYPNGTSSKIVDHHGRMQKTALEDRVAQWIQGLFGFRRCGEMAVQCEVILIWPKDKHMKLIGSAMMMLMETGLEANGLQVLTQYGGITIEKTTEPCRKVIAEVHTRKAHTL